MSEERPRKLAQLAELLRSSPVAQPLRPGGAADRLLPQAATRWLGDRLGAPEEEDEGKAEPPHESELADAVVGANGLPVQHAVLVAVPVEIAYNQFTQFERFPDFMHAVAQAEQIDAVRLDFELSRWGLRRSGRAHIVDQRPEERIAWRSVSGVQLAGLVTFHSIAERLTRVDASIVVEPAGLVQRIARRVGLLDRAMAGELNRFKAFIEMREEETGAWRGYIAEGQVVDEDDYFGWEPGAESHEDAPPQDAQGSRPASADGQGTEASSASPRRGGGSASRGAGAQRAAGRAGPGNGASAGDRSPSDAPRGKSDSSGAGPTRARRQTGGSRTRA